MENFGGCSDHNEEVARRDHLGMVMDEGQPTLLGIGCASRMAALDVWTDASRHGNIRLRGAIMQRVESSGRLGLTLRSRKSASCFRRNRFYAANERRECTARTVSWTRSKTTNDTVRTPCSAARKKINKARINAQDAMLRHVTGMRSLSGSSFCGPQVACRAPPIRGLGTRSSALPRPPLIVSGPAG